ncbi:leucine--tRNA ligase [Candidatus Saccharibacteria bacterium]|nr:leucine--tRNA ligase [Candidatus Saccharibacteria bacterium]
MKRYNPSEIEPKWQKIWQNDGRYVADDADTDKDKFYISPMFPYPSGAGMHVGHAFEHAIVDATARFQRAHGKNVLNPMGWDAFGLPAENYAIKTGTPPQVATQQNIANFKQQLARMGSSIDWSREINTTDPEYYKWTQWIFTKLFERGLAYQKESAQWWCPVDKTVLANEQVEGGKCWRCDSVVVKKSMKQWFFKITEYADELLEGLDEIDWPEHIKTAQRNWIGKSMGATIQFDVNEHDEFITVFSTRPDTIFGATFLVLAPEHPLVDSIATKDRRDVVKDYVLAATRKSEIERMSEAKEKTGVFTGAYAHNPATGEPMEVWVADYVLWGYGTGAIMAVPAHDERDYEFATAFDLPIKSVIEKPDDNPSSNYVYSGEGILVNSGAFDGESSSDARENIVAWLEENDRGTQTTTYKMRDWLVSRQRYWGAPIPIIHCASHGAVAVPEADLPVVLPQVDDYAPKGEGGSVLADEKTWVSTTCPTCGEPALRETDTMDGYACSSWYLLRYTDPNNTEQAFSSERVNAWAPVDMYIGGDHAVAHLLYVRFWTRALNDMGLVDFKEPVSRLVYHGYVNANDGTKMSKSKGNVVDPLEIIDQGYGADALKTYLLFMGPVDDDSAWDSNGVAGVYRFLNRVWTLTQEFHNAIKLDELPTDSELRRLTHKTIKRVTLDIHRLSFNTAIAALMELTNDLYKLKTDGFSEEWRDTLKIVSQLLQPVAPHISAEMWQQLHNGDIGETDAITMLDFTQWPTWEESLIQDEEMTIIVQVNGKLRAKLRTPVATPADVILQMAREDVAVAKHLTGEIKKEIYIPGKLVNIVC